MVHLLEGAPRFIFLTGKGGVGKTSVACASAVELAGRGKRVLLVSTDPASNVGQVFNQEIGYSITPIAGVERLAALEIDPDAAAEEYRQRALAPIRDFLSAKDLAAVTEQLSGSCTTEIASFNEFTGLLTDGEVAGHYDHVVFDTAPTGHTVRLLKLPGEWTSFLEDGRGDASCLGPMAGLEKTRVTYAGALKALADPELTRLALVARPQMSSLAEASRSLGELAEAGLAATHLVLNGILPAEDAGDELADSVRASESAAMASMPVNLKPLVTDRLPLRSHDMVGVDALALLLSDTPPESAVAERAPAPAEAGTHPLAGTVDELAHKDHGLIMVVGKGGVGKTTIAAALALALADRGKDVLLTTTDPAAHLTWTLGAPTDFEVSSIDPARAVAGYRQHVMDTKGANLDEEGRANLAEDLRSPCTEEVAIFQAFSAAVQQADRRFVVMDTAPTGHTLLLMDATGSYHREVVRNMPDRAELTPLARLQNSQETSVIVVTLPEITPVLEAEALAADLARAGIATWGWVVNRSLTPTGTASPLLGGRIASERAPLAQVKATATRLAVVPYQANQPAGIHELRALTANRGHLPSCGRRTPAVAPEPDQVDTATSKTRGTHRDGRKVSACLCRPALARRWCAKGTLQTWVGAQRVVGGAGPRVSGAPISITTRNWSAFKMTAVRPTGAPVA